MKKFQFSLEKVLEIKETEEKIIQRELAKVQNHIYEIELNIERIKEKISAEKNKINSLTSKIIKSIEIMIYYKYIDNLNAETEKLKEQLVTLINEENKIKIELLEKSKEKKVLERLKEIKHEEYKKQYNKNQQIILDDISIQHHKFKVGSI